jgi:pimeloyl-ACP methyl ester carboxylesterase
MGTDPAVTGDAAGVPYVAFSAAPDVERAPLIVVFHMMDPPRSERAMAAALPLEGVPACRVYLGLPMFGARMPEGGQDEFMRLGYEDALTNLIAPVVEGAAAELPAAVASLREQLPVDDGPIGLVGGSAGGAAALLALADTRVPVAAVGLVNPASRATAVIEVGERMFSTPYPWDEARRARADRLDFVRRAGEIAARQPQPPILLVVGEDDDQTFLEDTRELRDALVAGYASPELVSLVTIPGLGHPLADEPGVDPAPQSPEAARVDAEISEWFRHHMLG